MQVFVFTFDATVKYSEHTLFIRLFQLLKLKITNVAESNLEFVMKHRLKGDSKKLCEEVHLGRISLLL